MDAHTSLFCAYLLQYSAQIGLVLGAGSFPLQPQQQLWFPVRFEGQQVDDALPQGLVARRGHAAVPAVVGRMSVEAAAVGGGGRNGPLVELDTFT